MLSAILPNSDRCLKDRLLAYDIAARAVRPILDRNLSAILDCTYSRREFRRQMVNNVNPNDPLLVIEFLVTSEIAITRFENRRGHDATDLTLDLVVERVESYPYGYGTGIVNSEGTLEEIREQLFHILSRDQPLDREKWVDGGA